MRTTTILFAGMLAFTSLCARAGVIGSVPGCIDNSQYTFCNSGFTAPVSGSTWTFDVLFGSSSYIEALVAGQVEVNVFPSVDFSLAPLLSNFTVALLGLDGNPMTPPAFPSGPLDPLGELTRFSVTDIVAGSKIGGLRATMDCNTSGDPGPCATGMTFGTLAITLDDAGNMAEEDVTLRVGRLSTVPEPASLSLVILGLAGMMRGRKGRATSDTRCED